jgi:uncharacterized protein (DUF1501 family)
MSSRRDFLTQGLAVVSLGLGVPGVFGRGAVAAAAESPGKGNGRTLVVVQLAGGVDGVNTVIPYHDPGYRANRRTLAIPENDLLVVDDRTAFHPALAGLKQVFDAGHLAVIEAVGYPNPNFSHFKAMDIWQSADPTGKLRDGWLGRYFEGITDEGGHPLAGLSVGNTSPYALRSAKRTIPAVDSVDTYSLKPATGDLHPERRTTSLLKLYDIYRPANTPFAALLDTTLDNAYESSLQLSYAAASYVPAMPYPATSLGNGLRLLAQVIDSGKRENRPLRVGHVTLGGFDTHTGQPARLNTLLTRERAARHRPRHRRPHVRHGFPREGRLLRRPATADQPGQRQPALRHRLPLRLRDADRALVGGARRRRPGRSLRPAALPRGVIHR